MYCNNCSKEDAKLRCSRCKLVYYCSPECQKLDWKKHKAICMKTGVEEENKVTKKMAGFISKGKLYDNEKKSKYANRITKYENIREMVKNNNREESFENGLFQKLLDPNQFVTTLFPGINPKEHDIPRSFLSFLDIPLYKRIILESMDQIEKEANEVLERTKEKGKKNGDIMPYDTEIYLKPRVFNEAFARFIIKMMHENSSKLQSKLSENQKNYVDINQPQGIYYTVLLYMYIAKWNQIPDSAISDLISKNYTVIPNYIGVLNKLVIKDCFRYFKSTEILQYNNSENECNFIWLEPDQIQSKYPSLFKLMTRLQGLPYELNLKLKIEKLHLCIPLPNSFMLKVSQFNNQYSKPRLDSGTSQLNENGVKYSCCYFINNDENNLKNSNLFLSPVEASNNKMEIDGRIEEIDENNIEIDRNSDSLIIWRSDCFFEGLNKYEKMKEENNQLFSFYFYIYGNYDD